MNRRNILQGFLGGLAAAIFGKRAKAVEVEAAKPELPTKDDVWLMVRESFGNGMHAGHLAEVADYTSEEQLAKGPRFMLLPGQVTIYERHGSTVPDGTLALGHKDTKQKDVYWIAYDVA